MVKRWLKNGKKNHTHTHIHTHVHKGDEKICEMRTFTKIDKWRLARLKCQIRILLPRLFMKNMKGLGVSFFFSGCG